MKNTRDNNGIKLIVFDLWQTLAHRDVGYSTMQKIIEITSSTIGKERFGKIYEESVQTRKWNSKYEAYENFCRNIGLQPNSILVNSIIKVREYAEDKTKLYPHAIPMLTQLRWQGYKIGLLTNSSVFAIEQIKEKTDLLSYIDYLLPSYEAGMIKPNAEFFRMLIEMAGVKPEEAVMIGDKMGDDVEPARSIGMHAILYRDYSQLKKDFAELAIILE